MNLLTSMRYLVALNEHRHFARAAQACHITQPALSNALKALEDEFGAVIVRRGRVFGGLTPEGEQVLATALSMLRAEEALRQDLSAAAGQLKGLLRMAAVPTAIPMLTRFAALLRVQHPGITPMVLSMSSLEIETGLEDLSLDLALGYSERLESGSRTARSARITMWPQYQEHYFLLSPAAEEQSQKPVKWAQAARLPLCLLTPDMHNWLIVDQSFVAAGCEVRAAMETNSVLSLMLAVTEGGLHSVLPGALVATLPESARISVRPLIAPKVQTAIAFLTPSQEQATRAQQAALALMQSQAWRQQCASFAGAVR
ncbi:LysR family transcriptional regulator [Comamonas thiooxydans]|uniref:LysR family transcriptional regulator n=1 Tax=Comamonas thiooxydans TaxID=363952 RepID=UPI0001BB19F0|nr:LysR family transcriptional regulator [Comamonas thiooxydans]ACY34591.1 transcriptional regulator, LysR family [Comamonas thiooxydans]MDO1475731.1 LysR family transcriptional regulator [Comamonas thiooxydans]